VPDADGHVTEKRFADVSVPELRAAAQHEAKKHGKVKKTRASVALDVHATHLAVANRAVDRVVGRSNAARAEVSARTADGLVLVDVRGIPVGDLPRALAAVAKAFASKSR
jgi:hypothetical protein